MTQPLIVTQLLLKRAEIEAQIKSLEDRLGQARADLLHVAATRASISAKLQRGTFAATFLIGALAALGLESLHLEDL